MTTQVEAFLEQVRVREEIVDGGVIDVEVAESCGEEKEDLEPLIEQVLAMDMTLRVSELRQAPAEEVGPTIVPLLPVIELQAAKVDGTSLVHGNQALSNLC